MPTDANGIYQYTEAEAVPATFSGFLNRLASSVSTVVGSILANLTSINGQLNDTLWVPITLASGATVSNGLTPRIRRKNGIVYVVGQLTQGAGQAFVIPAGFAPSYPMQLAAMAANTGTAATVLVLDPPTMSAYTTTGTVVNLAHSWPVN
ncbi:hypothetical protein E3T28_14850 [Cryobacterium sinapicolor]|uniref:Phage tail protein n=1 Tax=Cryobacterium sinapicolor TaxID=1259236 RepID=A0ABY2ITY2_9MICO|nr:hypothetical protein [Cryobacterium sinapicolor]TFC94578.1 hypothetical protein E3T28_14850 [Cryobacterium sinapicolor]